MLHAPISVDQLYAAQVIVNLFNGGPASRVRLQVDAREPVRMQRFKGVDPTSEEMIYRFRDQYKKWIKAWPTNHLWKAGLPADLGPGTFTLKVTATDEYGHDFTAYKIIEVVGHGR